MKLDPETTLLSKSLSVEIASAFGYRYSRLGQRTARALFKPVTDRLAQIGVTFDRNVSKSGFSWAMEAALSGFVRKVTVRGVDGFPPAGPLLVLSNHPGTYDSLILASNLHRDDLSIISSDIPFLMKLPHAASHFFFISPDKHNRMLAARNAIRHLKGGGAVLVYGFGHLDPDPAVYNDAAEHIEQWVGSIEIFLRTVPSTRLLIAIVSHVVSARWRHSPLYWIRKKQLDKRRLVEVGQVMSQLLFPGKFPQSPYISFSPPVTLAELQRESGIKQVLPTVITRAKLLLADHMQWVNSIHTTANNS